MFGKLNQKQVNFFFFFFSFLFLSLPSLGTRKFQENGIRKKEELVFSFWFWPAFRQKILYCTFQDHFFRKEQNLSVHQTSPLYPHLGGTSKGSGNYIELSSVWGVDNSSINDQQNILLWNHTRVLCILRWSCTEIRGVWESFVLYLSFEKA